MFLQNRKKIILWEKGKGEAKSTVLCIVTLISSCSITIEQSLYIDLQVTPFKDRVTEMISKKA